VGFGGLSGQTPSSLQERRCAGNPIAAETVKQIMAREPVTLPLKSVPEGVSARAVDGRQVFSIMTASTSAPT